MPETLYTTRHVARLVGRNEKWVYRCWSHHDGPKPAFTAQLIGGTHTAMLWTAEQLDQWLAFCASDQSTTDLHRGASSFSDHNAVNVAYGQTMTWKLWWHNGYDGPVWWFSSPAGWWNSNDDGLTWFNTNLMVRPDHFSYYAVNGNGKPSSAVAAILRATINLRKRIAEDHDRTET